MSRPVHFEIQADDCERAKTFYTAVFGWSYEDYSGFVNAPYWGVVTGEESMPGINGGLLPRPAPAPTPRAHGVRFAGSGRTSSSSGTSTLQKTASKTRRMSPGATSSQS